MNDEHITTPDDGADRPTEIQPSVPEDGVVQAGAPEPVVPVCTECGSPLDEDQPYCLECGAPTPLAPKLRRRLGPAGILALGLGVLGIGAGTLAYALAKDDEGTASVVTAITTSPTGLPPATFGSTTFPTDTTGSSVDLTDASTATGLPPTSTPSTPFTVAPPITSIPSTPGTSTINPTPSTSTPSTSTPSTSTPSTSTPSTSTPSPTPTTPPTSGGADTWPDGKSGWTVIIASTSDQSDATAFRNRVKATGRAAGLIESSRYSTLRSGLWVVYVGVYDSRSTAISQANALRTTYPGAYAQRVAE
jgi:cell division septation protein DedD